VKVEEKLAQLATSIAAKKIPLSLGANLVMGRGQPNANLILIGEAPGAEEDMQGLPFVGRSGQLLDQMLAQAGLKNYYITNIVKYRPPKNRDPKKSEIAAFLPYLREELHIIGASNIATLGRHALSCFFPKAKISICHGKWLPLENWGACRRLMPLYHPAAALYDPRLQPTLQRDLRTLQSSL
jgi:uracil-DNA glycosylase family 4